MKIKSHKFRIRNQDSLQQNIGFKQVWMRYIFNMQTKPNYLCLNNVTWPSKYELTIAKSDKYSNHVVVSFSGVLNEPIINNLTIES